MNHKLLDLKRLTVLRVHGTSIQGAAGARRAAPGTRGRSGADSRSVARSVGEQRRAPCRPEPPCGFRGGGVFFFLSPPPFPLSPPPPSPVDLTLTGGFFFHPAAEADGEAQTGGPPCRAAGRRRGGNWPTSSTTGTPTGSTCSRSAGPRR